ncbi:MAG TPA: dihydrolipoyl dehydrogenase [Candidatus Krumholzibacteria bacterium]|nr:dihydrolipoyl dehydrogenase [Candidatus Krumholzibacteria bacterium]HPD70748.1 dihydrolipoyl dehydrogenase [Candidatus Krumholzibacteria bacterium]HRY39552.1 dihydrolipoyl dehydrogenase [Candidatus Krumholzibacteria bacterium]
MVMGSLRQETQVAVIGSGPGGYVAALRLADLGKEVVLVEERDRHGGTCLLEGCIPSKTLIHAVEVKEAALAAVSFGLGCTGTSIDLDRLRTHTDEVVQGLSQGVAGLLKRRGVTTVRGRARFSSNHSLEIESGEISGVDFEHCIIATGSSLNRLPPGITNKVWSSADALTLPRVPSTLLVVGGGYIGLELGLVYQGLGSHVSVVEFSPHLLPGADHDLVEVMVKSVSRRLDEVLLESKVVAISEEAAGGFKVRIAHDLEESERTFDMVLVAIGRRPNTENLGLEHTGIEVGVRGTIRTNQECRTTEPNIFAIGDVADGPMLAHKASREAKIAAEVICGQPGAFDNRAIPAVVYTDPEIAWTGLTEREAAAAGTEIRVGRFPLAALGRARTLDRTDGLVKIICDPATGLILGVGIVGPHASELIAEGTLAIEMGATLEDLIATIHPHPTLSEAVLEAAEAALGSAIHIHPPRRP